MKKITDLTEVRYKTVESKDAEGKSQRSRKEYTSVRPVESVLPGPRIGHFIIDLIAFQIIIYFIGYFFDLLLNLTNFNVAVSLTIGLINFLVALLLYPFLYAFCEYKWQRTPGKYLTRTLVIDEYGNKPELRTIVLRSLIRIVPLELFSCFGNDPGSRGWHDRWSGTWVVKEKELTELKRLQAAQNELI